MTAQKARATVKRYLAENQLTAKIVKARTVSFSDLARGSKVFVKVECDTPTYILLDTWSKSQAFIMERGGSMESWGSK